MAEVSPVYLPLFTWKGLQLQERFPWVWSQAGHRAPQLPDPAYVAAVTNHRVDTGGSQTRMRFERLLNEAEIRIGDRAAHRLRAFEALRLDCVPHRVGVYVEFPRDGADLPMFGVEEAADLSSGFRRNHRWGSPSS